MYQRENSMMETVSEACVIDRGTRRSWGCLPHAPSLRFLLRQKRNQGVLECKQCAILLALCWIVSSSSLISQKDFCSCCLAVPGARYPTLTPDTLYPFLGNCPNPMLTRFYQLIPCAQGSTPAMTSVTNKFPCDDGFLCPLHHVLLLFRGKKSYMNRLLDAATVRKPIV